MSAIDSYSLLLTEQLSGVPSTAAARDGLRAFAARRRPKHDLANTSASSNLK